MRKQTVYVVTSGEYSDYSIDAIFKTRELAEGYISLKGNSYPGHWSIEEHTLNAAPAKTEYEALVNFKTGEQYSDTRHVVANERITYNLGASIIYGYGKTPEHALKAARDNRAKLMAEKEGIS